MTLLGLFAHPDDECLGAGGTLAKHQAAGLPVHILLFGSGIDGQRDVARTLWEHLWVMPGTEDQAFDMEPIKRLASFASAQVLVTEPNIVITHSLTDLNRDHRLVAEATMIACRRAPVSLILGCQGDRHLRPFTPNYFVDITAHWPAKTKMLEAYKQFLVPYPDPRSLEGQEARARYWGTVAGVPMAEAFEVMREVR